MIAVVLVGGEGTRLRPLTWRTPKSMVPVLNRPFLEHALEHLRRHGFTEVILAVAANSLAETIRAYAGDGSAFGVKLHYSVEGEPRGSAGAFKLVEPTIAGGTFLVMNGDILTDLDLTAMLAEHRRTVATVTISLTQVEDPSAFGVVALEDSGRITRFVEKPPREEAPSNWINAGAWIFEPSVLALIPPNEHMMVENALFPQLIERGDPVFGFRAGGSWVDIGTPERYLAANVDLALRPGEPRMRLGDGARVAATAAVHGRLVAAEKGVVVEDDVVVRGAVVVGARSSIGKGAVIEDSVLWDDVVIGAGARISGSIVATGATIGEGVTLRGGVIAHGARVEGGEAPEGLRVEPGERVVVRL